MSNNNAYVSNELVSLNQKNTQELLKQGRNINRVKNLVGDSHKLAESLIEKEENKLKPAIDCKVGCDFCCYNQVAVTAPEVLVIADYLKANLDKDELRALTDRISGLDKITAGLNSFERKKIRKACPLLVNHQCSVYSVRPLSCRGWNSLDVRDCEKAFNSNEDVEIKVFGTQLLITNSISQGISQGFASSGFKVEHLELVAALKIALTKFNLAEKYLSGKQVFREARLNEQNNHENRPETPLSSTQLEHTPGIILSPQQEITQAEIKIGVIEKPDSEGLLAD